VFAYAPFALDESLLLEPQKCRIDRSLIQRQHASRHLLDTASDAETVQRAHGLQGFKDHQVQRAIWNISRIRHQSLLLIGYMKFAYLHVESQHEPRLFVRDGRAA